MKLLRYAYTIQWPRGNAEGILDLVTMHLFRASGGLRGTCTVNGSRCTVEAVPTTR